MLAVLRCRYVESGAALEKACWFQREANHLHRHDRPILRSDDVVGPKGIPDYEISVRQGTILLYVDWKSIVAGLLVRVVAGRIALSRIICRDPEVLSDEASALPLGCSLVEERKSICPWHELVGNGF